MKLLVMFWRLQANAPQGLSIRMDLLDLRMAAAFEALRVERQRIALNRVAR